MVESTSERRGACGSVMDMAVFIAAAIAGD
jgi:hypothetical protein